MRRSVPRSRPVNAAWNDPLEDLWSSPPPDDAPLRPSVQAHAPPGGSSGQPTSDERSLEIQARIEAEAREIAWQQTYGKSRNSPHVTAPAVPTNAPGRRGMDPTAPGSVSPKPAPTEPPAWWRNFTPIAFNAVEKIQGVYAIVQITGDETLDEVRRRP